MLFPNVPGAMVIQGAMLIPESRVENIIAVPITEICKFFLQLSFSVSVTESVT